MTLEGGGVLENAGSYYLTLQGLKLYPALRGETEFLAQVPVLFTHTVPAVASARELEVFQQMPFLNGTNLEQLSTSISSYHIEADINTLFHLHASNLQHASKNNRRALALILADVVLTLFILYYLTQSYIWNLLKICVVGRENTAVKGVQKPQAENSPSPQPNTSSTFCEVLTDATPQMRYSVYSLQSV
jgi:hypothetical protein